MFHNFVDLLYEDLKAQAVDWLHLLCLAMVLEKRPCLKHAMSCKPCVYAVAVLKKTKNLGHTFASADLLHSASLCGHVGLCSSICWNCSALCLGFLWLRFYSVWFFAQGHHRGELLTSLLLHGTTLFCNDLDGAFVLLPSCLNALDIILPQAQPKIV